MINNIEMIKLCPAYPYNGVLSSNFKPSLWGVLDVENACVILCSEKGGHKIE